MFGKILKGILLVILGMVLGIAGVAGAGVIAYKSVTVGQIADIARLGEDVVGEELRGKTVEEAIAFVGSLSNQSVGEIEALSPSSRQRSTSSKLSDRERQAVRSPYDRS